jgi:hypothetical protein
MTTKRRSRRRLTTEGRQKNGRERLSCEMEAFLDGDDSALNGDESLLRLLISEKFFADRMHTPAVNFTEEERSRLDELEARYEEWRLAEDHKNYRRAAQDCRCLKRYQILLKDADYDPMRAFDEAKGPGPKSKVKNIPDDKQA